MHLLEENLRSLSERKSSKNLTSLRHKKTGRWWGHYRNEFTNTRKEIEIDIVTLNENTRKILFGECKWKNNVEGNQVLKDLKEKADYFEGTHNDKNNEKHYLIVAKNGKW